MPTERPKYFTTLLRQLNAVRVATHIGDPLQKIPKGRKRSLAFCPIARALSNGATAEVDSITIVLRFPLSKRIDLEQIAKNLRRLRLKEVNTYIHVNAVAFAPTYTMKKFIRDFDSGEFKDLIEGK